MTDRRAYPDRPYVGVGAVIVEHGEVLLVKRKYDPLAGRWSLPGGGVEIGETLEGSLVREMLEETGLDVEVGPVIEVFDRITRDDDGRVRYHFVLVDYLCWPAGGTLQAGSDVAEAVFVEPADLGRYDLTAKAAAVIERAMGMMGGLDRSDRSGRSERSERSDGSDRSSLEGSHELPAPNAPQAPRTSNVPNDPNDPNVPNVLTSE